MLEEQISRPKQTNPRPKVTRPRPIKACSYNPIRIKTVYEASDTLQCSSFNVIIVIR